VLSAFRPCGRDLVEFFNSTGWALYGQAAVPMRAPDAGRLPRNIFHPVQIGCELACSRQLSYKAETLRRDFEYRTGIRRRIRTRRGRAIHVARRVQHHAAVEIKATAVAEIEAVQCAIDPSSGRGS
jgi:hypothetical protein